MDVKPANMKGKLYLSQTGGLSNFTKVDTLFILEFPGKTEHSLKDYVITVYYLALFPTNSVIG